MIIATIGEVIERHMIDIGFMPASSAAMQAAEALRKAAGDETRASRFRTCPRCNLPGLIRQEGCDVCTSWRLLQVRLRAR